MQVITYCNNRLTLQLEFGLTSPTQGHFAIFDIVTVKICGHVVDTAAIAIDVILENL